MTPEVHAALADWVKRTAASWSSSATTATRTTASAPGGTTPEGDGLQGPPRAPLRAARAGEGRGAGDYTVGKGWLIYDRRSPAALTYRHDGADHVRDAGPPRLRGGRAWPIARRTTWSLRRGPYVIAAGLDESLDRPPHVLRGRFIDLFDARLPILESVTLAPGSRHLLLDLDRAPRMRAPAVLASACKTLGAETTPDGAFRFYAEGPDKIEAVVRLRSANEPKDVRLDGRPLTGDCVMWDARPGPFGSVSRTPPRDIG